MTLFLASVVNPSGLEISAGLCLWCSGLVIAFERIDDPPLGLLVVMTTAASVLILTRPISPLWVALTVVILVLLAGTRAVLHLLRRKDIQRAGLIIISVTVVAIVWVTTQHGSVPTGWPQILPEKQTGTSRHDLR